MTHACLMKGGGVCENMFFENTSLCVDQVGVFTTCFLKKVLRRVASGKK